MAVLSGALLAALHVQPAAAQSAPSLRINPTSIAASGGTITVTPLKASIIGSKYSDVNLNSGNAPEYQGLIDASGDPTARFRGLITLVGAPAGMTVTSVALPPRDTDDGTKYGLATGARHRSVSVTIGYTGPPLTGDLNVQVRVDDDLLEYANAQNQIDRTATGPSLLSASLRVNNNASSSPLDFGDVPLNLLEQGRGVEYSVKLRRSPGNRTVYVSPTSRDTGAVRVAPARLSFNASNWNRAQTVTATPVDDADGMDEYVSIAHPIINWPNNTQGGIVSATVRDSSAPGIVVTPRMLTVHSGETPTYSVKLASQPAVAGSTVTVTGTISDTSKVTRSGSTASTFTLTFNRNNWSRAQTVTLAHVANGSATITHKATSALDGGYQSLDGPSLKVTTRSARVVASIALSRSSVAIDGWVKVTPTNATFIGADSADLGIAHADFPDMFGQNGKPTAKFLRGFRLIGAPSGVSVTDARTVLADRGTGRGGLPSGEWYVPFEIKIGAAGQLLRDAKVTLEVDRTLLRYLDPDGTVARGSTSNLKPHLRHALRIQANATSPLVFDGVPVALVEGRGAAKYGVALASDPGSSNTVTVTPTSGDAGAATVTPASLSFTGGPAGNWQSRQEFTVTPVNDADGNDESLHISHALTGTTATNGGRIPVTVKDNQGVGIAIAPTALTVLSDARASYRISLLAQPSHPVRVTGAIGNVGHVKHAGADRVPSTSFTRRFTTANWNQPQTVELAHGGSNGATTISHSASSSDSRYDGLDGPVLKVTAARPTTPRAKLSVGSATPDEGDNLAVKVELLGGSAPARATIIPLVYTLGSAEITDFTQVARVTVPANTRSATVQVAIANDNLYEAAETFTVALGALPLGVRRPDSEGERSAEITIAANDKPEVEIAAGAASVAEGTAAGFTITASNPGEAAFNVDLTYSEAGGYANFPNSTSVTFNAGDTTKPLSVGTTNTAADAPDGLITVAIAAGTDYTVKAGAGSASVAVNDDEATSVTISVPAGDIAEADGSKVITVTLGRGLVDGESLSLALDFGGAATLGTDYTLAEPTTTPTGVTYQTLDSAPTITFTGTGDNVSADTATLILSSATDALDEGASETVTVDLPTLNASSGTGLSGGASGSGSVSFAITDDDDAPVVSISGPSAALTEGDSATFTLTVTGTAQDTVTINIGITQVGDFVASGDRGDKMLSLASGTTTLTHAVATQGDSADERSGSVTVTLKSGTGYTVKSGAGAATVAVTDDDATDVTLSASASSIAENAGSTTVTVGIGRGLVTGEKLVLPLSIGGSAALGTDYTLTKPNSMPRGITYATPKNVPTVTFTGGATASATSIGLTLAAITDALDEGASETVTIDLPTLNAKSGTNLDAGASGSGSVSLTITDDDAKPVVSITGPSSKTEGEEAVYTIKAATASAERLTIALDVAQTGAFLSAGDTGRKSIELAAGAKQVTLTLQTLSDVTDEPSGSVTVTLAAVTASADYALHATDTSVATSVADDDATSVALAVPAGNIAESGGSKTLTVTLVRALAAGETLTVPLAIGGAAVLGTDYTLTAPNSTPTGVTYTNLASSNTRTNPPTVKFAGVSARSATLTLNATVDTVVEGAESLELGLGTLTATGLAGGVTGSGGRSFTITDSTAAPEISVTPGSAVKEGMKATFTLNATASSTRPLTLGLAVSQTGAVAAASEIGTSKTLVLPAGATSASYAVTTLADSTDEQSGSVTVRVNAGTGYSVSGSNPAGTVTVRDDDPTTLKLVVTDGTATEGSTTQTGAFTLTLSRALVNGERLVVPLKVAGLASFEYALGVASATGVSLTGNDLTFAGGSGAATVATVTLTARADSDTARNTATVTIPALSSGTAPILAATNIDGGVRGSGTARIVVTDAGATAGVSLSAGTLTVEETGAASYTVVLNTNPGGSVTVTPASTNTDLSFTPASLSFSSSNWNSPRRVTVAAAADGDTTNDAATITHAVSGYSGVNAGPSVTVTVNDAGTGWLVEPARVAVTAGSTVNYTVKLKSQPTAAVTLNLTSGDATKATVTSSVTIQPVSWNTGASVTVTGVASGTTSISHSASTTDANYSTGPAAVPVTVSGSAAPELFLKVFTHTSLTEGASTTLNGSLRFRVFADAVLTEAITANIVYDIDGDWFGAATLPSAIEIPASTREAHSTRVALENDNVDEPNGSVTVRLAPSADYRIRSSGASVTYTMIDNDATTVRLARNGGQDVAETGGVGTVTVSLGTSTAPRTLVEGETLTVPLVFSGTATFGTDYTLAAPNPLPPGVTYTNLASNTSSTRPTLTFTGGSLSSSSATLRVVATSDAGAESRESIVIGFGSLSSSGLSPSVGGGSGGAGFVVVDDDGSGPELSIKRVGTGQNIEGFPIQFQIDASTTLAENVTVNLNVGQMGDFVSTANAGAQTVGISGLSRSRRFQVSTASDNVDEPDGSVSVTLVAGEGYTISSAAGKASAEVEVADDDKTRVTLSVPGGDLAESGGSKLVTVRLGRALVTGEKLVQALTLTGTAANGTHYSLTAPATLPAGVTMNGLDGTTPSITFTGGAGASRTATLTLTATADSFTGAAKTLKVALGARTETQLSGGTEEFGSSSSEFKIHDTAAAVTLPVVSVAAGSAVTESSTTTKATFTVSVADNVAADLPVKVTVSQRGAWAASSALGKNKTVTIASGTRSKTHEVTIVNDTTDEPDGSVSVAVAAASGYTVSSTNGIATVAVTDDDPTGVRFSAPKGAIDENGGTKVITVTLDRPLVSPEVLKVPISFSGATLNSDFTLTAPSAAPSGVTYQLTESPPAITFTGPAARRATFTLTGKDDVRDEGAGEALTVGAGALSSTSGTSLDGGASAAGSTTFTIADDDGTPTVTVAGGAEVTEGTAVRFTFTSKPAPREDITVTFTVGHTGDVVTSGNRGSKSVVIGTGSASATYDVATDNDTSDELTGTATVVLDATGTGWASPDGGREASVDVKDNDPTTVTLSLPDASATELDASAKAQIKIALGRALITGEELVVPLVFSGGAIGTDFTLSGSSGKGVVTDSARGRVTFTGGAGALDEATFDVTASQDADETDETVTVSLGALTATGLDGGASGARTGNGQITLKDAGAQPAVDLDKLTLTMKEEDASGSYRVKLHTDPGNGVTVRVTPSSGDTGRLAVSGALSFSGGTSGDWGDWQTVTLTPKPDGDVANNDVTVSHTVTGYPSVNTAPDLTVSITDRGRGVSVVPETLSMAEAANQTYSLSLHSQPTHNVTITPTSTAAAVARVSAALTFTPSNWKKAQTVTVTGGNAGTATISHAITTSDTNYAAETVSSVSVTVTATARVRTSAASVTATERGAAGTYTVWLNTDPGANVTVTPATTSTEITLSGGPLTFTGGAGGTWNDPQTITVTANTDLDSTSETATITHAVSGYPGVATGPRVSVTVRDAGGDVLVSPQSLTIRVGQTATYKLEATTTPSNSFWVNLLSSRPTVASLSTSQAAFPNTSGEGDTTRENIITVTGESAGTATITNVIGPSLDPLYVRGTSLPSVSVTVTPEKGIVSKPSTLKLLEGTAGSYTVELASDPGGAVTVTPSSADGGAVTVSGALSFNSSNWSRAQTVTVTAQQDNDTADESVEITHNVSGYTGVTSGGTVTVAVVDDEDKPELSLTAAAATLTEGGTATINVNSDKAWPAELTVNLSISAPARFVAGGLTGSKTVALPADATTVAYTVATSGDNTDEPNGLLGVTLGTSTSYYVDTGANYASTTIHDDDATSVTLTVPNGDISEAAGTKTLTVALGRGLSSGEALPVPLKFSGTATFGTDYALSQPSPVPTGVTYSNLTSDNLKTKPPTVTFTGASASSATITLTATDDTSYEGATDEDITVALGTLNANSGTDLGGGASGSGTGTFSITENDMKTDPLVTIAADSANAIAEGSSAAFTVTIDEAPAQNLTVTLNVADAPHGDFVTTANEGDETVVIQATKTTAAFSLATVGDNADEASGDVTVTVADGADYDPGSASSATVTVTDNDATTVALAVTDASAAEDDTSDPAELTLTLGRGLVSGEALKVPVAFSGGAPGTDFTLACPTSLPTGVTCADLGNADAAVTFTGPATGATATSVALKATAPDDVDTDHERVTASIPASTSGTPKLTATNLDGGATGSGSGVFVLSDDDTPPLPTVSLSVSDSGAVTEGGALTVTAEVSQAPSGSALSIPVQRVAANSTAEAADYTLASSIAIADGATSGTATLTARSDSTDEPAETLRLSLGTPPEGYENGTNDSVDVTITDNDATTVVLKVTDDSASEGEATATAEFTLTLGRALVATESLAVPVAFSGGTLGTHFSLALSGAPAGVTLAGSTVTFTGQASAADAATVVLTALEEAGTVNRTLTVSIPAASTGTAPILAATGLGGGATGSRDGNGRIALLDNDIPVISVTGGASVAEGANASFTLTASPQPSVDLDVTVNVADDATADFLTSAAEGDRTVTIAANTASKSFTVATDDGSGDVDEPRGVVTATVKSGSGYNPHATDSATVTVTDNDATTVTLSAGSGNLSEAGGTKTVTITLGRALAGAETLTVPLDFTGTATRGTDYTTTCATAAGVACTNLDSGNASVAFSAPASAATLTMTGIEDTEDDDQERVALAIGTLAHTNLDGDATASGSVSFNITEQVVVGFTSDSYSVEEGGRAPVEMEISEALPYQVTGAYGLRYRGEADASDLVHGRGPYKFGIDAGDTRSGASRAFDTVQDTKTEGDETFTVFILRAGYRDSSGYVDLAGTSYVGPEATTTVTILDDESPPAGVTVTPASLSLTEGGAAGSYDVSLRKAPAANVTVTATTADAGAARVHAAGGSPGASATLTFTPSDWNQAQAVTVTPQDDADEDDESTRVRHSVSGTGEYGSVTAPDVTVSVGDDDKTIGATTTASFAQAAQSAPESAGTRNVRVNLNPAPATAITVNYQVTGTATAGSDFSISGSGSVSVSANATSVDIPVAITDDSANENDETVILTLTSGSNYLLGTTTVHRLTITDNDSPPLPAVGISGGADITEGGTATFTLTATPAPAANITVNVSVADSGSFANAGQTGSKRVTVGTSGTATLTVTTDDDSTDEPNGRITATLASGSGYTVDSANNSDSVAVNDNDLPLPKVGISGGAAVTEGGGATFTLTATPAPQAAITVNVIVAQTGSFAASGQTGGRTVSIGTGGTGTFTVDTDDDSTDEPNGRITATLGTGTGYTVDSANRSDSVAVNDDDEPVPEISITSLQPAGRAAFEGEALRFRLSADIAPTSNLDIDIVVAQPSNSAFVQGTDTGTKTVTIQANTKTATYDVPTHNDTDEENPSTATITVTVSAGTGYTVHGTRNAASAVVADDEGIPGLSIADAEGPEGSYIAFPVTLTKPAPVEVELYWYATVHGPTQLANQVIVSEDLEETAGTLRIPAGASRGTIDVWAVDDSHDDPDEQFWIMTTGARGAVVTDGEAIGTVRNDDPIPGAWLARFGRAVAEQALDGIAERMTANRTPGLRGSFAGQQFGRAAMEGCADDEAVAEGTGQEVGQRHAAERAQAQRSASEYEAGQRSPATRLADRRGGAPRHTPDGGTGAGRHDLLAGPPLATRARPDGLPTDADAGVNGPPSAEGCGRPASAFAADAGTQPTAWPMGEGAGLDPSFGGGTGHLASVFPSGAVSQPMGVQGPGTGTFPAPGQEQHGSGGYGGYGGAGGYGGYGNHGPPHGQSYRMTLADLLAGSSFAYNRKPDGAGGVLGFWGRGARSQFQGADDALRLDGEITTAMLGADYARGDWLLGLALTQSIGRGDYDHPEAHSGQAESTLTAAIPWASWRASERLTLWGAAGYGGGRLTVSSWGGRSLGLADTAPNSDLSALMAAGGADPAMNEDLAAGLPLAAAMKADIAWRMAALGGRGELFGALGGSGPALALVSDALWTSTSSGRARGLAQSRAETTRLRLGIEGSFTLALGAGTLTPKLETGLRRDGGDADQGFGVELGGGLAWADPRLGLALDLAARTLLAHQSSEFEDMGYSASLTYQPAQAAGRGPSLTLRQDYGGQASGGLDSLFQSDPLAQRMGGMAAESRWTAEAGWGLPAFRGRFVGTPTVGYGLAAHSRDYSVGWRLEPAPEAGGPDLSLGLMLTRRESLGAAPEHGVGLEVRARW